MLDQDTLRSRVVAARELRGLTQEELGARFAKDGLGKHDPGRIERGKLVMQRVHRDAFIRLLDLPERWFTEPDTDRLIAGVPHPTADEIVVATIKRLARLSPREMPGWLGRLSEAEPTIAEGPQEEEPPQAEDAP